MKTDELIGLLATGVEAVDTRAVKRRHIKLFTLAALCAMLLMAVLLRIRADLFTAMTQPIFWLKIGFVFSLFCIGLAASRRLSKPGLPLNGILALMTLPIATMWVIAIGILNNAASTGEQYDLLFGATWKVCPLLIAMLSIPVFIGVIQIMRELAPTQLRQAGFAAGLLSGTTAALVYSLHCPETEIPFIGVWYTLGMLVPAVVGAVFGGRWLRW